MVFDLGIIGAGPAGYEAAKKAGREGLHTVLFDKQFIGGVCLNEGCIPTKTLLHAAKIYEYAKAGNRIIRLADGLIESDEPVSVMAKNHG